MKRWQAWMIGVIAISLFAIGCSEGDDETITPDGDLDASENVELETDGDGEAEEDVVNDTPEPDNRVVYEIHGPTSANRPRPANRLPFPYNFFTEPNPQRLTGLQVKLSPPPTAAIMEINTNLIDTGLYFMNATTYTDGMNALDGFSTFAYLMFEVTPELDTSLLPQTPEESVTDDSLIWLVNLQADSDDFGQRIPVWVEQAEGFEFDKDDHDIHEHLFWYVRMRPTQPLMDQTRYALVVRKGLKTTQGDLLEPARHFLFVSDQAPIANVTELQQPLLENERTRMAEVFTTLESDDIGIDREDLLLAVDFTTQTVVHDLENIRDRMAAGEFVTPVPDFDVDDDGSPDLYDNSTYPSEFPGATVDMTDIGAYLHGTIQAPDFRLPRIVEWNESRQRAFDYDENQNPKVQDTLEIPFVLYLPKEPSAQPCPVIIVQHGISSKKEDLRRISTIFAKYGWATLTADFVYHGERSDGNMAALSFIDIVYPLKARSSWMQATSDHLQIITMLRNWDLDLYPQGGDGTVDLDSSRVAYIGQSLGGIVGGITSAVSKDLGASIINVGGGGLMDFVAQFLSDYGINTYYPDYYMTQYSTVAQTILDAGDSVNYARFHVNPPQDYASKWVLLQESIDDETVPNPVSENYARAANMLQLNPAVRPVYGLTPADGPTTNNAFIQFDPANHNSLLGHTYPETTARIQAQIVHFFQTFFDNGQAEVIVPETTE